MGYGWNYNKPTSLWLGRALRKEFRIWKPFQKSCFEISLKRLQSYNEGRKRKETCSARTIQKLLNTAWDLALNSDHTSMDLPYHVIAANVYWCFLYAWHYAKNCTHLFHSILTILWGRLSPFYWWGNWARETSSQQWVLYAYQYS